MTDADKVMNPLRFGSNVAEIKIRINADLNPRSLLVEGVRSA